MLREFAASLDAYRDAARRGAPEAVGVLVDDELMTMPIYRGDWVSSARCTSTGSTPVLHNERLVDAARRVFDAEIVRPLIVFSNLTAPMPQNRKHTDVPDVPWGRALAVPGVGGRARWPPRASSSAGG